ncbi:MAG: SLOG family protein [Rikenellaceae bacterium]|nr:SLOG family protein [Rikenellaceae bacterium]
MNGVNVVETQGYALTIRSELLWAQDNIPFRGSEGRQRGCYSCVPYFPAGAVKIPKFTYFTPYNMKFNSIDSSKTVAFSGYRPDKLLKSDPDNDLLHHQLESRLLETIRNLAREGYKTYLTGMAAGFDLMAASAVLKLKKKFTTIKLVCMIPFPEQAVNFPQYWKSEYARVLVEAYSKIEVSGYYHRGAFHKRNDFLLDNSSVLVCYYDGQTGGTQYTVQRARLRGLKVYNLCETDRVKHPYAYPPYR